MNTTGRISESGYSGLCVDMFAETKCDPNKHDVCSTQQTHGSADSNSEDVAESHSQTTTKKDPDDEDEEKEDNDDTCIEQDEVEEKDNMEVQIGSIAFGLPYGLERDNDTYIMCEVREHRLMQDKDEFKCSFDSEELDKAKLKKQWIPKENLVSYNKMLKDVEQVLNQYPGDVGTMPPFILEEFARTLKIDPAFVQILTKKRKAQEEDESIKRQKLSTS